MTPRLLLVCLGNICRSPSAEAVLRARAEARGLPLVVDSAGTGDWHIGKPPYGPMQEAARARGLDLSGLRARQVTAADFDRFDLVLGMDADNMAALRRIAPPTAGARLAAFTEFLPDPAPDGVPDPYFTRDFEGALDLIERTAEALLDHLAA